jgi:hypothetical protein
MSFSWYHMRVINTIHMTCTDNIDFDAWGHIYQISLVRILFSHFVLFLTVPCRTVIMLRPNLKDNTLCSSYLKWNICYSPIQEIYLFFLIYLFTQLFICLCIDIYFILLLYCILYFVDHIVPSFANFQLATTSVWHNSSILFFLSTSYFLHGKMPVVQMWP